MFIGHYGVSFAARAREPRLSLGWYFLAVQGLDVLFSLFVFVGWEHLRIVPGFTAYNPYDLYDMPFSHSLVASLGWSALAVIVARALRVSGAAAGLLGLCVLSHFALDLPMHTRDLPVFSEQGPKLGFGLWNHRTLSLIAEWAVLGAGMAIYWVKRRPVRGRFISFALALFAIAIATPFMPPPASTAAFAMQALVAYLLLAAWAGYVDAQPASRSRRSPPGRSE